MQSNLIQNLNGDSLNKNEKIIKPISYLSTFDLVFDQDSNELP